MNFAHPWVLLLLGPFVPLLTWWAVRRAAPAWRYSNLRLVAVGSAPRVRQAKWGGMLLRGLLLTLLVLALAGPRWSEEGGRPPTEGVSIAMTLDISASMGEADFDGSSRLDAARRVFRQFIAGGELEGGDPLPGRPADLVALIAFAKTPRVASPLTLDHRLLIALLDEIEPTRVASEATTNPGDGLAQALVVLGQAPTARKVIVLLTDGEANVPEGLTPRQAAQLAANLGIPIYLIDVSPETSDIKEQAGLHAARTVMQEVARMTQGRYFRATEPQALRQAWRDLDALERSLIPTYDATRYHDVTGWFVVPALVVALALALLELTAWRRSP
jgi:Ca-activated chloride channel family protein